MNLDAYEDEDEDEGEREMWEFDAVGFLARFWRDASFAIGSRDQFDPEYTYTYAVQAWVAV